MTNADEATLIIQNAERFLVQSLQSLPATYFDHKDARTYLFNNIMRLVDHYEDRSSDATRPTTQELIGSELASTDVSSLYVGVPWCEQMCSFCNFAYSTSKDTKVREAYLTHLARELSLYKTSGIGKIGSVYFGGGTPTAMEDILFAQHLQQVLQHVELLPSASVTCEATINTLTSEKLAIMKQSGVTRLSVGVQSLDDDVRQRAKLLRSADEVVEKLEEAKHCFSIFNVDLIYGYPFQSLESWFHTVKRAASTGLPSITTYRLEVKDRTLDLRRYQKDRESFTDEMTARIQYFIAMQVFESHGYVESPLGWWIQAEEHRSDPSWRRHMEGWSKAIPYIGLGQGAFSMYAGLYCENQNDVTKWIADLKEDQFPNRVLRTLDSKVLLLNRILRVLRTYRVVDLEVLADDLSKHNLLERLIEVFKQNVEWGLLKQTANYTFELTLLGRALVHWLLDEIALTGLSSDLIELGASIN